MGVDGIMGEVWAGQQWQTSAQRRGQTQFGGELAVAEYHHKPLEPALPFKTDSAALLLVTAVKKR